MLHRFRGRLYTVLDGTNRVCRNARGDCDPPRTKRPKIRLRKLKHKSHLYVAIHEATHAMQWDLDEEVVKEISRDLASFIWKLGYRRK